VAGGKAALNEAEMQVLAARRRPSEAGALELGADDVTQLFAKNINGTKLVLFKIGRNPPETLCAVGPEKRRPKT
jgi:hypothetical protein